MIWDAFTFCVQAVAVLGLLYWVAICIGEQ